MTMDICQYNMFIDKSIFYLLFYCSLENFLSDGTKVQCIERKLKMKGPMGTLILQTDQVQELRSHWPSVCETMQCIQNGERVNLELQLGHFVQLRLLEVRPYVTLSRYWSNQHFDRLTVNNTVIGINRVDFDIIESFLWLFY